MAAKNKKKAATTTRKEIGKADAFYIESHFGKKDAADLAGELSLLVEVVQAYIDKLVESGFKAPERPEPKTGVEKAGFAVHDPKDEAGNPGKSISVAMTRAASEAADELNKSAGRNETFFNKRVKNGIHVIDPSRPVR